MIYYKYEDLASRPNLSYIGEFVGTSEMVNKDIGDLNYNDEATTTSPVKTLVIAFEEALVAGDQTILAGIVDDSLGKEAVKKKREVIFAEIFDGATSAEQSVRLLSEVRAYSDLAIVLDNYNYPVARSIVQTAYDAGEIPIDDYNLAMGAIPSSEWI